MRVGFRLHARAHRGSSVSNWPIQLLQDYPATSTQIARNPRTVVLPDICGATFNFTRDAMRQLLNRLKEFDQRRPNFPGEHLIVATVGASLLRSAARRSPAGRLLSLLVGGALMARAASGRGGVARLAQLFRAVR